MTAEQLKDIKGVIYVFDWGTFFFLAFLFLLIAVAGYLIFKRLEKLRLSREISMKEATIQPKPFNEIALEKLEGMDPVEYFEKNRIKEFYFKITEVVRQFLADNYHIDTLEKTSLEIIEELERVERSFTKVKDMDSYFSECDMVKFAKLKPELAEMKQKKTESIKIIKEYYRGG